VYQLSPLCYFVIDLCECSLCRTYFFRHLRPIEFKQQFAAFLSLDYPAKGSFTGPASQKLVSTESCTHYSSFVMANMAVDIGACIAETTNDSSHSMAIATIFANGALGVAIKREWHRAVGLRI
jgi:hypothetical protein